MNLPFTITIHYPTISIYRLDGRPMQVTDYFIIASCGIVLIAAFGAIGIAFYHLYMKHLKSKHHEGEDGEVWSKWQ